MVFLVLLSNCTSPTASMLCYISSRSNSATTFLGVFTRWAASTEMDESPSLSQTQRWSWGWTLEGGRVLQVLRKGRIPLITTDSSHEAISLFIYPLMSIVTTIYLIHPNFSSETAQKSNMTITSPTQQHLQVLQRVWPWGHHSLNLDLNESWDGERDWRLLNSPDHNEDRL